MAKMAFSLEEAPCRSTGFFTGIGFSRRHTSSAGNLSFIVIASTSLRGDENDHHFFVETLFREEIFLGKRKEVKGNEENRHNALRMDGQIYP